MEDDGATRQAFWDDAYLDTGGDMASFVGAFEGTYNKGLLMVERLDTHELCGAFWATNIVRGHQAFASMWMHTAARGQMTVEAAHLALANMFEVLKIRQIWSMTPWVGASALCLRMRFEHVAVMPDYCQWDGQLKSVHLYRLTKERFDARPHH